MKEEKIRILISNDDGITSPGLTSLIDMFEEDNVEIVAVAPEKEHSGQSHAITIDNILRIKHYRKYKNAEMYLCLGTPVDCVKAGLFLLCADKKPDIILSGINLGYNFSISTIYSGTAAAALEGAIAKIPSLALSLGNFNGKANDFAIAKDFIRQIIRTTLATPPAIGTFLNVNIPPTTHIKGVKVCKLAKGRFEDSFKEELDPRGKVYYWLSEDFVLDGGQDSDNDYEYLKKGYITIVPIHFDITAYKVIPDLKALYE